MSDLVFVFIFIGFAACLGLAAVGLTSWSKAYGKKREEKYLAALREIGINAVEMHGEYKATYCNRDFWFIFVEEVGDGPSFTIKVVAKVENPREAEMWVMPARGLAVMAGSLAGANQHKITTGNKVFDTQFATASNPPAFGQKVLSGNIALHHQIINFPRLSAYLKGSRLSVYPNLDDRRMDTAQWQKLVDIACQLAEAVEQV